MSKWIDFEKRKGDVWGHILVKQKKVVSYEQIIVYYIFIVT